MLSPDIEATVMGADEHRIYKRLTSS